MANVSAADFAKVDESLKVLQGNLDQLFLIIMGVFIFREYAEFSFLLQLHFCESSHLFSKLILWNLNLSLKLVKKGVKFLLKINFMIMISLS